MITKQCSRCKLTLSADNFSKRKQTKDGLLSFCKSCQSKRYDKWKGEYREAYLESKRERNSLRRRNAILQLNEYLRDKSCSTCPESRVACLDFHHLRDKEFNISEKIGKLSWVRIINEIQKCEVICANCHRIKTAEQQRWYTE